MKTGLYNLKNEKVGTVDLPEGVFGVAWNPTLVHQVLTAQLANKRRPWAHAKTRAEVRGGGRKPWRQKGTGRARSGSTRSPVWVGGATVFGPQPRSYAYRLPRSARRTALCAALALKQREG